MSASPSPALAPWGIPLALDPLALEPPDELPPELLEEDEGVELGDCDPDAGGELPQPAATRAIATSAAPNQALPDLVSVLLMVKRPPIAFRSYRHEVIGGR